MSNFQHWLISDLHILVLRILCRLWQLGGGGGGGAEFIGSLFLKLAQLTVGHPVQAAFLFLSALEEISILILMLNRTVGMLLASLRATFWQGLIYCIHPSCKG